MLCLCEWDRKKGLNPWRLINYIFNVSSILVENRIYIGNEEGKDQESNQSSTTPDTGHHMSNSMRFPKM